MDALPTGGIYHHSGAAAGRFSVKRGQSRRFLPNQKIKGEKMISNNNFKLGHHPANRLLAFVLDFLVSCCSMLTRVNRNGDSGGQAWAGVALAFIAFHVATVEQKSAQCQIWPALKAVSAW